MPSPSRLLPPAWSLLLAVLMLGPALFPGYVLSYDMVWVPDLALRPDAIGTGSALPRAVPSDAVVAVLDEIVPGMVLQKVVLLGSLVGAGLGAAALVGGSLTMRLVAVSLAQWNPFVVERLVIGHWPVLVGYAVLPWVFVAGRRLRTTGRMPCSLPLLVVLGSLSASTGVATGLVALLTLLRRGSARANALVAAVIVAANAPWLVAGLLHAGSATSAAEAARLFATGDEGLLPAPLAALSLGGIWNAEVVPGTRTGVLGVAFLVVLLVLAAAGVRRVVQVLDRPEVVALGLAWAVGMAVALVSWSAPDAIGWVAEHVPGGGLLRDGSRLLALSASLTVVLAANGAAVLQEKLPDRASRVMMAGILAVLPITLTPDAAFGAAGALRAVDLPASYSQVREAVAKAPEGDVVVLPFTSYRAPEWNGGRKVLDPLPRVLDRAAVADDQLSVSGRVIAGEDLRAAQVRGALAAASPEQRATRLAALGVSAVVVAEVSGQDAPAVVGRETLSAEELSVVELDGQVVVRPTPSGWTVVMSVAWALWVLTLLVATVCLVTSRRYVAR